MNRAAPSSRDEYAVGDGSTCVVVIEGHQAGIERWVNGECVWGQVFSHSYRDVLDVTVADVVAAMRANPEGFNRRLLWDADGRAVSA